MDKILSPFFPRLNNSGKLSLIYQSLSCPPYVCKGFPNLLVPSPSKEMPCILSVAACDSPTCWCTGYTWRMVEHLPFPPNTPVSVNEVMRSWKWLFSLILWILAKYCLVAILYVPYRVGKKEVVLCDVSSGLCIAPIEVYLHFPFKLGLGQRIVTICWIFQGFPT